MQEINFMKTELTGAPKIALTLHIPATLNAQLIAEAEKEKRSRHAQIIYTLGKFFEPRNAGGKKDETK